MKRLVLFALLLGSIGGILQDLPLLVSWFFFPQGRGIYLTAIGFFAERVLFVTPICMTKWTAERSPQLLKRAALIGIISGVIIAAFILLLFFLRFGLKSMVVSVPLLGLSVGFIC